MKNARCDSGDSGNFVGINHANIEVLRFELDDMIRLISAQIHSLQDELVQTK